MRATATSGCFRCIGILQTDRYRAQKVQDDNHMQKGHNRDFRIFPLSKPGEQARDPEDQHVLPARPLLRHLLRRPRPCRGRGPGEEKKKEKNHLFELVQKQIVTVSQLNASSKKSSMLSKLSKAMSVDVGGGGGGGGSSTSPNAAAAAASIPPPPIMVNPANLTVIEDDEEEEADDVKSKNLVSYIHVIFSKKKLVVAFTEKLSWKIVAESAYFFSRLPYYSTVHVLPGSS